MSADALLLRVLDAMADAVVVGTFDGIVLTWNDGAERMFGWPAREVVGREFPGIPDDETAATCAEAFARVQAGKDVSLASRRCRADGTVLDIWISLSPLARVDDDSDGWLAVVRETTQGEGAPAKLVEQTKDVFLAITSHELRTPITVVQGYASTLLTHWDQLADADRRESVERIFERTKALGALVEQLLLGARAGSITSPRAGVPFDLTGLLHTTVSGFAVVTGKHELVLDVPQDLPSALGDPSSVEIVVGQLVENAIKYSPDGGEVTVIARANDAQIVIKVCDRGIGIPSGEHVRIFERFHQVGGERRPFGGVGLGLYIVRKLLDAQGGSVKAYPRDGGGSCLEVMLPRAAPLAVALSQ